MSSCPQINSPANQCPLHLGLQHHLALMLMRDAKKAKRISWIVFDCFEVCCLSVLKNHLQISWQMLKMKGWSLRELLPLTIATWWGIEELKSLPLTFWVADIINWHLTFAEGQRNAGHKEAISVISDKKKGDFQSRGHSINLSQF